MSSTPNPSPLWSLPRVETLLPDGALDDPNDNPNDFKGFGIPKQQKYEGPYVIQSELANQTCKSLGVDGMLKELNAIMGTSYTPTNEVIAVLQRFSVDSHPAGKSRTGASHGPCDFGYVYGCLRPFWFKNFDTLQKLMDTLKDQDAQMRRDAVQGPLIVDPDIRPRRLWDLYSNRVVPSWATHKEPIAVSHAWRRPEERQLISTPINAYALPVPIPQHVTLEHVRVELLSYGAEYAWLDVLCLRQDTPGLGMRRGLGGVQKALPSPFTPLPPPPRGLPLPLPLYPEGFSEYPHHTGVPFNWRVPFADS